MAQNSIRITKLLTAHWIDSGFSTSSPLPINQVNHKNHSSDNLPPAAGGGEKYAISYITPTGLGKNVRLGSYKHITPTGFWKAAANNLPPAAGGAEKTPVPQGRLIE